MTGGGVAPTSTGTNTKHIVRRIEETLENVKGVVGVLQLSYEDLERILELEENYERMTLGGPTRSCNEGVREVLRREQVLAIAKTPEFPQVLAPTVMLVSNGEIIGEEVADSKAEKLRQKQGTVFVGENFVIYRDRVQRSLAKESLFVFPPTPFPLLEQVDEIRDVVSASPAIPTDLYVKSKGGWNLGDTQLGTVLIGFNLV